MTTFFALLWSFHVPSQLFSSPLSFVRVVPFHWELFLQSSRWKSQGHINHDQGLFRSKHMMLVVLIQNVCIHQPLLNTCGFQMMISLLFPPFWRPRKTSNRTLSPEMHQWHLWKPASGKKHCQSWAWHLTHFVLPYSNEDLMSNQEASVTAFRFNSGLWATNAG